MLSLFIFTVKKGDKKVEASGLSPGTRVGVSPLPFSSLLLAQPDSSLPQAQCLENGAPLRQCLG